MFGMDHVNDIRNINSANSTCPTIEYRIKREYQLNLARLEEWLINEYLLRCGMTRDASKR